MFKSKIVRNASFVSSGAIVSKILALVTLYFTSRLLGPGNFGAYNFAVVYAGYFAILADFGTTQVMIIKGAQQPENRSILFWQIAYFRSIIGLVIAGLLICSAFIVTSDVNTKRAIIISSLAIPIGNISGLLGAFFISDQMHNFKVIIETFISLAVTAFSILFLYLGYGYVTLILIGLLGVLCMVAIQYKYLRGHGLDKSIKIDLNDVFIIIKVAAPFGVIIFLNNLFNRVDIVLIQNMLGANAVGVYSAAYKLMNNVAFIPGAVTSALFPVMSIMTITNPQHLGNLLKRTITVLLSIGLPIALLTTIWGADFVMLYFGDGYKGSVLPLIILGWAVPIMFINSVFIHLFYAYNWLKKIILLVLLLVAVNIGINIFLLKMIGIAGAAVATVACECLAISYYFINMKISPKRMLAKIPANITVMLAVSATALATFIFVGRQSAIFAKSISTIIIICGIYVVLKKEGLAEIVFKKKALTNAGQK